MKKVLFTLFLLIITALPVLAAPTNTSGPWGIDAGGFRNLSTALAAPGYAGKTFVISKPMAINNKTLPSTRHIQFTGDGRIDPTAGTVFNFAAQNPMAGGHQIFGGAGAVTGLKESRPEWFGPEGLGNAIASLAADGVLRFSGGTYALTAGVNKSLVGAQKWIVDAPSTIQYTGSEITYMVLITLNGNSFSVEGPLKFDANLSARTAFRVNNNSATMNAATEIYLDGLTAVNAKSTDTIGHTGAAGLHVHGGYNLVKIFNCRAINISRAAGVGTPGQTSTNGIIVSSGGINAYPKEIVIENPYISKITSEEVDGDANNTDCDGLAVFGPNASANGGLRLTTSLIVRGGKFVNCRGRSIKSQVEQNLIDGAIFVRDSSGDRTITNGQEIDFQFGSGTAKNIRCNYTPLAGATNPFGASFAVINATASNNTSESGYGEGVVTIENVEIINNVPAVTVALPYFFTVVAASPARFSNIHISNVSILGEGAIDRFVHGNVGAIRNLAVKGNYFTRMTGWLVYASTTAEACKLVAKDNRLPNSSSAALWGVGSGLPPILVYSGNNYNFGATVNEKGESITIADDATYVFAAQKTNSYGPYSIKNNFTGTSQGFFSGSYTAIVDMTAGASTLIAYGTAAVPPDVDGKVNVWLDSDGRVHVKNRLGSSRVFTLNGL